MKVVVLGDEKKFLSLLELESMLNGLELIAMKNAKEFSAMEMVDFLIAEDSFAFDEENWNLIKNTISLEKVFIVTSTHSPESLHNILKRGVRDFFTWPISLNEISIKILAAVDVQRNSLFQNCHRGLSLKQQLILEVLKIEGPQGANRETLLDTVWNGESVEPKNVDVHIHNLRKILRREGKDINFHSSRWYLNE